MKAIFTFKFKHKKPFLEELLENKNKEIEILKEEIKGYEQERERVLNIIDERNHKAIEHIDKELYNINVQENIMLKNELLKIKSMLQGVDKE